MRSQHSQESLVCDPPDFYRRVKNRMQTAMPGEYAIVSLDFDNFNFINDLFSYAIGDLVLFRMEQYFCAAMQPDEFFSHINADLFTFWVKTTDQPIVSRFAKMTNVREALSEILPEHYNFVCSGGIVHVDNPNEALPSLLDKAYFARKQAKGNHVNTFLLYNTSMSEAMNWKKVITMDMESALQNGEFEMYLQPKVLLSENRLAGAEALVRWNSARYGLMYPDRFIPVLEQNGFVRKLDFYMLEQACLFLKQMILQNRAPLPISVNFSKTHLRNPNFVEQLFHTVHSHGIAPQLIEIELTENVFAEDFAVLMDVVSALKHLGFTVSLDDFGRAYSSLNLLKDLPVDIIKIDKSFLDDNGSSEKGRTILSKLVDMIQSLHLTVLVEGVETAEQVEFLCQLHCELGQGYFYAKPMPAENFLAYSTALIPLVGAADTQAAPPKTPPTSVPLLVVPQEFRMDSWELYHLGKNIDMGLLQGYLDGDLTIQYVNDRALEYMGYTRQELYELFHNRLSAFVHPEDMPVVRENMQLLLQGGKPIRFQTRAICKDGKIIVLQGRSSCIWDKKGRPIGLHAFQDVTADLERTNALEASLKSKIEELEIALSAERESREALRLSEERFRLVVEQSDDILFDWDFETDVAILSPKYETLFGHMPILTNISKNKAIRQRIHMSDRLLYDKWLSEVYRKPGTHRVELRMELSAGHYLWICICTTAICNAEGAAIRVVGVFINVDQQKREMDALKMKSQCDSLTQLLNKEETHQQIEIWLQRNPHRCAAFFIIDLDSFKSINDNLGHQFGDAVLRELSQKMRRTFCSTDILGRLGGDEMCVFMPQYDTESLVIERAELLLQAMRATYYGETKKYEVSGSIGIAYAPRHGDTFMQLYAHADSALYASKRRGKGCCTVYDGQERPITPQRQQTIQTADRFLSAYFSGDPIFNIFGMLYETKEPRTTTEMLLCLLGSQFHADRVYICECDDTCLHVNQTYEWCADGITPSLPLLSHVPATFFPHTLQSNVADAVFMTNDISSLSPSVYQIFSQLKVQSILHCALSNEGKAMGLIGFNDCHDRRVWRGDEVATLSYVARVLSVFLTRTSIKHELEESYKNHVEMLDNLNGFVYVIDPDVYEILYANKASVALGITVGKRCYEAVFDEKVQPCGNCPVAHLSARVPQNTGEIYCEKMGGCIHTAVSRFTWADGRTAVLVCCTSIEKQNKH